MRESTTPYVLLGILGLFGPKSGYEIRAVIDQSVGHFWSESFGQIYPHLRRLADSGLIRQADEDAGPRERRRFAITEQGLEALEDWSRKPPQRAIPRSELAVKIFFGRFGELPNVRFMIESELRSAKQAFEVADAGQLLTLAEDANDESLAYFLIITELGRVMADARRRWTERALSLLDAMEAGGNRAVIQRIHELRAADARTTRTSGRPRRKGGGSKKKNKEKRT